MGHITPIIDVLDPDAIVLAGTEGVVLEGQFCICVNIDAGRVVVAVAYADALDLAVGDRVAVACAAEGDAAPGSVVGFSAHDDGFAFSSICHKDDVAINGDVSLVAEKHLGSGFDGEGFVAT